MLSRLAFLFASAGAFGSTGDLVEEFLFSDFEPYFGYTGSLAAAGTGDGATFASGYVDFAYVLAGLDPDCETGASTAANSCGIHIHEGTSCDADGLGHFYDPLAVSVDPWASVVYAPDSSGNVEEIKIGVVIGYTAVVGRVMIVHDFSGARIACAAIVDDSR
ncbi:hypothetical protein M885DRAFT_498641 [Pelagophyceae sp. CCMP2097]|nr:hypothetical protein M885DRAFT_498641 [Pelagophyceae sp. CCMP2097]